MRIWAILASAWLMASCSTEGSTGTLRVGEDTLRVEIARTDEQRQQGLMWREELPEDSGMAFLFDEPREGGFWMKDTLIPLSIAFWDSDGRVVAILDMEPCETDTCPRYDPGVTYVGAVETNQGWFEGKGIGVGDSVELSVQGGGFEPP